MPEGQVIIPEEQVIINEPTITPQVTQNVIFRQGTLEDFNKLTNFANNTFYIATDASLMKIGNLIHLHSIINLTQEQYDILNEHNFINPSIIYCIIDDESLSDFPYITKNLNELWQQSSQDDNTSTVSP